MSRETRNKRKKAARKQRKADGMCVLCGVREAIPGLVGCDWCYDKHLDYLNELQQGRRELGFCVQCGDPVKEKNPRTLKLFARCTKCRAYQKRKVKLKRDSSKTVTAA